MPIADQQNLSQLFCCVSSSQEYIQIFPNAGCSASLYQPYYLTLLCYKITRHNIVKRHRREVSTGRRNPYRWTVYQCIRLLELGVSNFILPKFMDVKLGIANFILQMFSN